MGNFGVVKFGEIAKTHYWRSQFWQFIIMHNVLRMYTGQEFGDRSLIILHYIQLENNTNNSFFSLSSFYSV